MPAGAWDVAVFDNRFPSLGGRPRTSRRQLIVPTAPAEGQCEVVVFTQDPKSRSARCRWTTSSCCCRSGATAPQRLGARDDIQYVLPFENRGAEVGVTLHHPHGQIYAYPVVPPVPARMQQVARRITTQHGARPARGADRSRAARRRADAVRRRARGGVRAGVRALSVRGAGSRRSAPVEASRDLDDAQRADLARALKTVLLKYDGLWQRPLPYLMAWYQAPTDGQAHPEAHLHAQFYPPYRTRDRLKYLAGTELGAGFFAMDALPEDKARELQQVEVRLSMSNASPDASAHRAEAVADAPGRVNLLGEHTDYNDGFVLPIAIAQRTRVAMRRNGSDAFALHAASLGETVAFDARCGARRSTSPATSTAAWRWRGARRAACPALDIDVDSDVPMGVGLSSSAALEVATLRCAARAARRSPSTTC